MSTTTVIHNLAAGRKAPAQQAERGRRGRVLRSAWAYRLSLFAALLVLALSLLALLAPWVAPYDAAAQFRDAGRMGQPLAPSARFWLGTDNLQRDLLSRLIVGARVTLSVGLGASALAVLFGLCYGGLAGLAGGAADNTLMRAVDVVISLPLLFIIMLLVLMLGRGLWVTMFAIAAVSWAYPARVFRAETLVLKEQEFITAARCVGAGRRRIFLRHVLPHLAPLGVIYVGLGVPAAIFAEAGLSFLGLGIPPPTPAWGSMVQEGLSFYRSAPLLVLMPGLCIMLTSICFNVLGSGLRDALDPALR